MQKAGGAEWDMGTDIAVDAAGNSYVTGSFYRTAAFGPITLTSTLGAEHFIAKYDANGQVVWAERLGGSRFANGYKIALDPAGNIYLAGSFAGTVSFGSITFTNNNILVTNLLLAKFTSAGKMSWVKVIADNAGVNDIAIDAEGNIYLTGTFISTTHFGGITYTSNKEGSFDRFTVFTARLDALGNCLWAKTIQGNGHNYGYALGLDAAANIYVTGQFIGNASVGGVRLSTHDYASFIAKYDPTGKTLWAKQFDIETKAIATDAAGNSWLTGSFLGSPDVGPAALTSRGFRDIFIMKLDPKGQVLWARSAGGASTDIQTEGAGIAVDGAGNCFVTGTFLETAFFGQTTLQASGHYDAFVARYSPEGDFTWVRPASGTYYEAATAIAVDPRGNAYCTGRFFQTTHFGSIPLTSNGIHDAFVARIGFADAGPTSVQINAFNAAGVCEGTALQVSFRSSGNFNADNTFIAQLSDANGSFAAPVNIGTGSASPIPASFPADIAYDSDYRIRVIASSPVTIVQDSGIDVFGNLKHAGLQTPNIITPNDDGMNEAFEFPLSCLTIHLKVYNRWGKLVYEQANYQNTWKGGDLPNGTYYYHLTAASGLSWKGWIEINR